MAQPYLKGCDFLWFYFFYPKRAYFVIYPALIHINNAGSNVAINKDFNQRMQIRLDLLANLKRFF